MKPRRQIHQEALLELGEAAEWHEERHEERREGLGGALLDDFEDTLEDALGRLMTGTPAAKTEGGLPIRRFRLAHFSRYAIYIVVISQMPVVVAFEHSSRRPGYWRNRLK